jgi:hypothetical protein
MPRTNDKGKMPKRAQRPSLPRERPIVDCFDWRVGERVDGVSKAIRMGAIADIDAQHPDPLRWPRTQ